MVLVNSSQKFWHSGGPMALVLSHLPWMYKAVHNGQMVNSVLLNVQFICNCMHPVQISKLLTGPNSTVHALLPLFTPCSSSVTSLSAVFTNDWRILMQICGKYNKVMWSFLTLWAEEGCLNGRFSTVDINGIQPSGYYYQTAIWFKCHAAFWSALVDEIKTYCKDFSLA